MAAKRVVGVELGHYFLVVGLDILPLLVALIDLTLNDLLQDMLLLTGLARALVDAIVLVEFLQHLVVALDVVQQFLGSQQGLSVVALLVLAELVQGVDHI